MAETWTERQEASRRACLAKWPDAEAMGYHPSCCRFPKSCSIETPPPAATPPPPRDGEVCADCLHEWLRHDEAVGGCIECRCPNPRPAAPSEPTELQAEAQQDDERDPCLCCGCITDACQCDCCCALTAGRAGAGEQQRELVADVIADHQSERLRPDGPIHHCSCGWGVLGESWSLHVADELLALLDRTQPDDDPGPQCPSTSHDTDGGWRGEHRAGHDEPARWVTQPGDDRQHRDGGDCPCGPIDRGRGIWDHR